jgi:hypothetical protein
MKQLLVLFIAFSQKVQNRHANARKKRVFLYKDKPDSMYPLQLIDPIFGVSKWCKQKFIFCGMGRIGDY